MALYSYEDFSKDGKRVRGTMDASSAAAVKESLSKQGLFPVSITAAQESARYGFFQRLFMRRITTKDKILLTNQLAVLLKAGTPVLQALELLVQQFDGRMRMILISVKDDVKEGSSLADALKKFPNVFDTIYVQLVRAGEASGRLEQVLERLASYLERREALAKQVKGALMMPMIQMAVAAVVVVILLVKVVPQMVEVISAQGKQLPAATQILISVSDFAAHYYLLIAGFLVALYLGYRSWSRTDAGARFIDKIKLRLPLIKYLTKTNAVVQFSYTLGMLLEGGVNIAEALDIVCKVVENRTLAKTLQQARENIIKQGKIAQYLKQTDLFPPIAIYLIKTGEESGALDTMLLTVAANYEQELKELTRTLTALLGPATLIFMALVVGFIIAAVAVPMLSLGEALG